MRCEAIESRSGPGRSSHWRAAAAAPIVALFLTTVCGGAALAASTAAAGSAETTAAAEKSPQETIPAAFHGHFVKLGEAADTFTVQMSDLPTQYVIRVAGVRAPRSREPFWARCATELERFLEGERLFVQVLAWPAEPGGPLLAQVLVDDGRADVAATLARSGCAVALPGASEWLAECEAMARSEGRCIWTDER